MQHHLGNLQLTTQNLSGRLGAAPEGYFAWLGFLRRPSIQQQSLSAIKSRASYSSPCCMRQRPDCFSKKCDFIRSRLLQLVRFAETLYSLSPFLGSPDVFLSGFVLRCQCEDYSKYQTFFPESPSWFCLRAAMIAVRCSGLLWIRLTKAIAAECSAILGTYN